MPKKNADIKVLAKKINALNLRKAGHWDTPLFEDYLLQKSNDKYWMRKAGISLYFRCLLNIESDHFLLEEDLDRFERFFKTKLQKDIKYFKWFRDKYNKLARELFKFSTALLLKDYKGLDARQILRIYKQWDKRLSNVLTSAYTFIAIDNVFHYFFLEQLSKTEKIEEMKQLCTKLLVPKKLAIMISEEDKLFSLAKIIYQNKPLLEIFRKDSVKEIIGHIKKEHKETWGRVVEHRNKFCWLVFQDWTERLYDIEYYVERLKEILKHNPSLLIKQRVEGRIRQEEKIKRIIKSIKIPRFLTFINLVRDFIDAKMYRWDSVAYAGYCIQPLLKEIGRRTGFALKQMFFLTTPEMISISRGRNIPKHVIKARMRSYAFVKLDNQIHILTGSKLEVFRGYLVRKEEKIKTGIKSLSGTGIYPGTIRGKVKVILGPEEIPKMRQGEILVCPMTDPDYLPAIRKAKGFITDEGGLLTHAAIVAREFKIPGIIGTKVATRILKDGQNIELDASKGEIKILK